jgi:glycosyltransferase involved in cell wall biosynthesis
MKFSIVIPAYNEAKILDTVLNGIKKIIAQEKHDAEIIVVDDGSRDRTAEVAASGGAIVLRHEKRRGYGAALKTGIAASKNEIIAILDGDGSYPAEEIPVLLGDIDKYDMVIGARVKKGVKMPFLRRIPKFILARLAEYLVMEDIPDINSGLRVFKKSVYKKYVNILPDEFSFTLTITLAFINNNEKIKFLPIGYHKRKGISKIRPIHDTANFLFLIIRTVLYFNPLRVFLPLAATFVFIAAAVAFHSIFIAGRFLDVTTTLLVTFGIQIIVLGLIADLINRRTKGHG